MIEVLASPVDDVLTLDRYGRAYNLLDNLKAEDVTIEAAVGEIQDTIEQNNVHVTELTQHEERYTINAFQYAYNKLQTSDFDVYHHMHLGYPWFNPLLLYDYVEDIPTVIGPCEPGHDIDYDTFSGMFSRIFGSYEPPDRLTKAGYIAARTGLEYVLDPVRIKLFARTLRNADRIVVINEETKRLYGRYVDKSKLDVVPYGVNLNRIEFSERDPNSTDFLTVGYLIERKGFQYAIDAMAEIVNEYPEARLHIVGDGPARERLESHAMSRGIDDSVMFHGFVEQSKLVDLFTSCLAFVHPSLSEGFSHVRLEAMASGCPVIGTDIIGAPDVMIDGVNSLIVSKESTDALVDSMRRFLEGEVNAVEMGRQAREMVEDKHQWSNIGSQYLKIYRKLT